MNKAKLRERYKKKRKELTEAEISQFQESIYQQIFEFDFSAIKNVHIFLPIKKYKEINTYPIIDYLRRLDKTIIVSKSNFSDSTLQHYIFENNTEIEINKYGIPEPVNAQLIDVKKIDLVFVPLLISDENNYRVGYGKGFYDRFLAECNSSVKTIGLNFFKPIKQIEDLNKYDMTLNVVIYPV